MNAPLKATLPDQNNPEQDGATVRDVIIVGTGFSGICLAIKLREAGVTDILMLEKADDFGGTWRDNTYPGCACDVQSHLYSYSFEGNANWSKSYAGWSEIQDYILHCVKKYQLRPLARFGHSVAGAHFDEVSGLWHITTDKGESLVSRFFVMATGPLHVPAIPSIAGLNSFKGRVFHSARWEHDFNLTGKRVASIGTGGSAIQYVPEIAPQVSQLKVFQRTPAWVLPRHERAYTALEKNLFAKLPLLRKLHRLWIYCSNELRLLPIRQPLLARVAEAMGKRHINKQIADPKIASKMTPDYTIGCKRILISNKYYPAFNRDNVELVTEAIKKVTETGIETADGRLHEVDAIILGTGFVIDPRDYMKNVSITGKGGISLLEQWKDGPTCYKGLTVENFPNFFQMTGPNSGLGHNSIIYMIESQVSYIVDGVTKLKKGNYKYLDVKPQVLQDFNDHVQVRMQNTVWTSGCVSWYQQKDGRNIAIWPGTTFAYRWQTRHLNLADYEVVVNDGADTAVVLDNKVAFS
jgi:cation diffusion facilitator CzcD-associated flavoprotein CzcO